MHRRSKYVYWGLRSDALAPTIAFKWRMAFRSLVILLAPLGTIGLLSVPTLAQEETEVPDETTQRPGQPAPLAPRPLVTAEGMPSTGPVSFGMEHFDTFVPQFLAKWDIPGASVAIVRKERLVFARSYGLSNAETGEKMQPQSRFRLASISKVLTATAILQLIDAGKLSLDDRVLEILSDLKPFEGQSFDPRTAQLTVQHLLQHTEGWERGVNPDTTTAEATIARTRGLAFPIERGTVIRHLMAQPLQHDPGTRYSYCNFGYMLLGEIIEKVTEQSYESYVREHVLTPAGVQGIRLGRTQIKDRAPSEVRYHMYQGARPVKSVFDATTWGARCDVGVSVENNAAVGGWIASSVDLARFMVAIDGQSGRPDVLSPRMQAIRNAPPTLLPINSPTTTESSSYYGDGLRIIKEPRNTLYSHTGSLQGTSTLFCWSTSGTGWVLLFNGSPKPKSPTFYGDAANMVWKGIREIRQWPQGDLFEHYKPEYKD